jgi:two-component system, OmpR family, sensor histidine kinase CpxA
MLPRSLFLKIFVWFMVVMLTVIAGTFVVSELMRPDRAGPPMRRPLEPVLAVQGQTAAELYERDGQSGLLAQLDRIQRDSNVRVFLFNEQLQELSGRRVPDGAQDLARGVFQSNVPQFFPGGSAPLHAQPVHTLRGGEYVLVAEMPPRPPSPGGFHPIFHVLGVALVGAAFCYWLARYLTSPVTKLRKATQELAAGNLRTRVVPALGNRRDELASLGADFDVMAEQIESLINSQRRLLGDISHELRSPLARLNVALELARQRSGAEATSALERIQREAENLNEMIGQLLALTRLESGAASVAKTQFDLAQLVREIADDADFEARSRNRSVTVNEVESCVITGNYELLRRAIENVVRNAIQYTSEGTAVEVELRRQGNRSDESAVIIVRDHGAGVPDSALEKIFQPFYRVDEARDREAGGVGLGLAIAERAVRLHGGNVKATNAADGGLIVIIEVPEQTADSRRQTAKPA